MTLPAPIDITQVFPPLTVDDVREIALAFIAVDQNPITDWHSGAIFRTMFELESFVTQDLVNALNGIFGNGDPDAGGDSQTLTAHAWYEIDREVASFAAQTITLACDATHGPYSIIAGRLYRATDGSIYSGLAGGTLGTGSTLTLDVGATSPGAMRGLVASLIEPLAGVTVQSAAVKVVSLVPQFGADAETDTALFARTDARFEDLDAPLTDEDLQDRIATWALAAGTTLTRLRFDPDTATPGAVILTLANGTGGVSGGEVTTIRVFVDAHTFDLITYQAATNETVNAGGVVSYPADWTADQLAAAKAAADGAWELSLSASKIGGTVTLAALNKAVMDQGTIDFTGKTLNGTSADLALASAKVPAAGTLPSALDWNPN